MERERPQVSGLPVEQTPPGGEIESPPPPFSLRLSNGLAYFSLLEMFQSFVLSSCVSVSSCLTHLQLC